MLYNNKFRSQRGILELDLIFSSFIKSNSLPKVKLIQFLNLIENVDSRTMLNMILGIEKIPKDLKEKKILKDIIQMIKENYLK